MPKAVALAEDARIARQQGRELESTYRELARAHEKTKELERLKTQFFANVSHELRTPLALILGPAELLGRGANLTPEQLRDVDAILRNGAVLLKHVNDLLDASKLEAGKLRPDYVEADLARILRLVAANFDGVAGERAMAFRVHAPPTLRAQLDEGEIARVVTNLLSNAFKFTPRNGSIRSTLRESGDYAVLEVADSGPGVPPKDRELVFERFVQGDGGSARVFGGTGLGLAIVKDFVLLHGGSVDLDSAPEGGALFTVRLPLRAPPGTEVKARPSHRPIPTRRPSRWWSRSSARGSRRSPRRRTTRSRWSSSPRTTST